ncbi:indolepyruvate ferredoxin oxidoreductase subunit alpha [bacterium]
MAEIKIHINNELCDFCGTCVAVCPVDAIELRESTIQVDDTTCTQCKICVDICPLGVPEVQS